MDPTPQAIGLTNLFPNPTGREYSLTWSNGTGKGQSGYIRMTDFLFNYYFLPLAFGLDGAAETRTYAASNSVTVTREIGGSSKTYSRKSYTRKITPTYRTSGYDTGTQLFVVDGDDVWNFEIGGKIDEFRIWIQNTSNLNLKRAFEYRTITGVGATATPLVALP